MKKNYMAPSLQPMDMGAEYMLAASITGVGGNAEINLAGKEDPIPDEADVNANPFGETLFD